MPKSRSLIFSSLAFAFSLAIPGHAIAQAPRASSSGAQPAIGAHAIITTDADWLEKWQRPSIPSFSSPDSVPRGKPHFFIVFLNQPAPDASGVAHVSCDVKVQDPHGKVVIDSKGMKCFEQGNLRDPRAILLSKVAVRAVGEATDPLGTWRYSATARDLVCGRLATTSASIQLTAK